MCVDCARYYARQVGEAVQKQAMTIVKEWYDKHDSSIVNVATVLWVTEDIEAAIRALPVETP